MAKSTPEIKEMLAHEKWVKSKSNEARIKAAGFNAIENSPLKRNITLTWGDLMTALQKNGLEPLQWRLNDLNRLVKQYPGCTLDYLIVRKLKSTPII